MRLHVYAVDSYRHISKPAVSFSATVSFRHAKGAGEGRSGVTPSGESHFAVRTVFERDLTC